MTPLERDALPGALLDPLIERLSRAVRDGFASFEIVVESLTALTKCREALLMGEWQPIETAPKDGEFLVYLPEERTKIQTARFHPNVQIIGCLFAFDMTKPSHWMHLPIPPAPSALAQKAPGQEPKEPTT